jgi:sugar phosphate isomerase/epimerase
LKDNTDRARRQILQSLGALAAATAMLQKPPVSRAAGAGRTQPQRRLPAAWVPGLQLYTLGLGPNDDLSAALRKVAAIGYRQVEFPGHYGHSVDQLKEAVAAAGLVCPSVHVLPRPVPGSWHLEGDLSRLAADLHALGARYAVVSIPLLPDRIYNILLHPPAGFNEAAASRLFATLELDDWKRTADMLNEKAAVLERSGIRIAYHNHAMDFHPLPAGANGYHVLLEHTDPKLVGFQLDIGWAVAAKQDLGGLFKVLGGRVRMLHLKDTKRVATSLTDLASTDLGTGIVDWHELVALVRDSRIEYMFVEQEPPFVSTPLESARIDYEFMSRTFGAKAS